MAGSRRQLLCWVCAWGFLEQRVRSGPLLKLRCWLSLSLTQSSAGNEWMKYELGAGAAEYSWELPGWWSSHAAKHLEIAVGEDDGSKQTQ